MDGEAGWWTTSGNIGLPPLARAMGVGRQQQQTRSIKCEVPQGSILGPLLFTIYMIDICNVSELLYTIMYADDTSGIMSSSDLESLIQSVNSECLLNTWLKANK